MEPLPPPPPPWGREGDPYCPVCRERPCKDECRMPYFNVFELEHYDDVLSQFDRYEPPGEDEDDD